MTALLSGVLAALGAMLWLGDGAVVARRRVVGLRRRPATGWWSGWRAWPVRGAPPGKPFGLDIAPRAGVGPGPRFGRGSNRGRLGRPRSLAAVMLGAIAGQLVGGTFWAVVATGSVLGACWLVAGRDAAVATRTRTAESAALPSAADLLVVCLASGASPEDSLALVAAAVGPPLASRLEQVSAALRLGAQPAEAWASADPQDPLAPLRRAFARAADTGAPLADTVAGVADDQRQRHRWRAQAAARRAGVLAVGPLVLCFLPAFVLLGVVPIVLGIAGEVLGDLR